MVGLFWVVEDRGGAALIALCVPLEQADQYGDMLTRWTRVMPRLLVGLGRARCAGSARRGRSDGAGLVRV
jgi:hypothetical protein